MDVPPRYTYFYIPIFGSHYFHLGVYARVHENVLYFGHVSFSSHALFFYLHGCNLKGFTMYSHQAATVYRKAMADAVFEAREVGFPLVHIHNEEEEEQIKRTGTCSTRYAFHSLQRQFP